MKYSVLIGLFLFNSTTLLSQPRNIDSLRHELEIARDDTSLLMQNTILGLAYAELEPDSSAYFAEKASALAGKLAFKLLEANAMDMQAYAIQNMGNYPRALRIYLDGIKIAEDPQSENNIPPDKYMKLLSEYRFQIPTTPRLLRLQVLSYLNVDISLVYETTQNQDNELFHKIRAAELAEQSGYVDLLIPANMVLARHYQSRNKMDSALYCAQKAFEISNKQQNKQYLGGLLLTLGRIHLANHNKKLAKDYFERALVACDEQGYVRGLVVASLYLSDIYMQEGMKDLSIHFAYKALALATQLNSPDLLKRTYRVLSSLYEKSEKKDSTIKYQKLTIKITDSLFNSKQAQQFQNITFDEQQRRQEIESEKKAYRNRMQTYVLLSGIIVFLTAAVILWRSVKNKQKAYSLLNKQKQETDIQKAKVEHTLEELRSTQAQLIQSEKMASLGEITAGIAHEIQNPLNFVNNFSEVNAELLNELKDSLATKLSDVDRKESEAIINDMNQNLEKINQHGKRADSIVKGMLQHSRLTSGHKEPTDVNSLADEYLKLSYQAMRAKEKTFNAILQTDFDKSLPRISIVPQDIGRVLINLYNNAFYFMLEKAKLNHSGYEPAISVLTKKMDGKIKITVKDNGTGIPEKIKDKIFQPFFTTKPTGQGTGLGLSLSYDIIISYGGNIQVNSTEGIGSEFVVEIPLAN